MAGTSRFSTVDLNCFESCVCLQTKIFLKEVIKIAKSSTPKLGNARMKAAHATLFQSRCITIVINYMITYCFPQTSTSLAHRMFGAHSMSSCSIFYFRLIIQYVAQCIIYCTLFKPCTERKSSDLSWAFLWHA